MRFINVRELRSQSARVWQKLDEEGELVLTSNGKPIAVISSASEDTLEESLIAIRQARAVAAVAAMQQESVASGRNRMSQQEINAEIRGVRTERRR
jgi:antitoxin (DNA-binding transcriptional repressor) of toxin-antitoxin stability system